jgi:hypothetical protein
VAGEWTLHQVLVFFNFSGAEGKGGSFNGVGVRTMIIEQMQQANESTR